MKGFGFVEYYDKATAESAFRNLNNTEVHGRNIRIDFAEDDYKTDRKGYRDRGKQLTGRSATKQFPWSGRCGACYVVIGQWDGHCEHR